MFNQTTWALTHAFHVADCDRSEFDVFRLLARDAGGESEGVLLNETVPSWVIDIVVDKKLPKFIKVTFYVLPHKDLGENQQITRRFKMLFSDPFFFQVIRVSNGSA